MMHLIVRRRHLAALRKAHPEMRKRVRFVLGLLQQDARDRLDIKELTAPNLPHRVFRVRVATWRIAYYDEGDHRRILRIFPRTDGYDWLSELEL